nr:hypothetical protein CFP56_07753 [Quercus suber]
MLCGARTDTGQSDDMTGLLSLLQSRSDVELPISRPCPRYAIPSIFFRGASGDRPSRSIVIHPLRPRSAPEEPKVGSHGHLSKSLQAITIFARDTAARRAFLVRLIQPRSGRRRMMLVQYSRATIFPSRSYLIVQYRDADPVGAAAAWPTSHADTTTVLSPMSRLDAFGREEEDREVDKHRVRNGASPNEVMVAGRADSPTFDREKHWFATMVSACPVLVRERCRSSGTWAEVPCSPPSHPAVSYLLSGTTALTIDDLLRRPWSIACDANPHHHDSRRRRWPSESQKQGMSPPITCRRFRTFFRR